MFLNFSTRNAARWLDGEIVSIGEDGLYTIVCTSRGYSQLYMRTRDEMERKMVERDLDILVNL